MAQINIGGTSANVQLKGNNTITTDQAFTFPDTGGTIVTDDFTGDVEIDGSITAAGSITCDDNISCANEVILDAAGTRVIVGNTGFNSGTDSNTVVSKQGILFAMDSSDVSNGTSALRVYDLAAAKDVVKLSADGTITAGGISVSDGINSTREGATNPCLAVGTPSTWNIFLRAGGSAEKSGSLAWTAMGSERRIKKNIQDFDATYCWNVVKDLSPHTYVMKADTAEETVCGYIVDEVESVAPELVLPGSTSDEQGEIRTYDYGMLVAMQAVALQTALTRIEALEAKLAALQEAQS